MDILDHDMGDLVKNESAAVWVDIAQIKPWANNPRKNENAVAKVAASIKRFGFGSPILARSADNEIIAGHTRYAAAQSLGLTRVPVRFLDLDPAEAHILAIADNKTAEIAEWDDEMLGAVLNQLQAEDLLNGTGFTRDELDKMLNPGELEEALPELGGLKYSVVVECDSEEHQAQMLAQLEADGLRCKPLIT